METQSELLTIDDVAAWLKVPRSWCYRAVAARSIPFLKLGHHLRFRREEIQAWLDAHAGHASDAAGDQDTPQNVDPRVVETARTVPDAGMKPKTHRSNGHGGVFIP